MGSSPNWFVDKYLRCRSALIHWVLRHERQHDALGWRLTLLAWIAVAGMPLYYVVWSEWFPQPYESLGLRLLGVALCLPAPWARRLMHGRVLSCYLFAAVTYVLPFFFTYMYLMNGANAVWSKSLLIALIILFHFPTGWALGSCLIGVGCACVLFALTAQTTLLASDAVLGSLPLYGFAVLAVSGARIGQRALANEKLSGMAQGLAVVSHELRTPLVTVDANLRGIARRIADAQPGALPDQDGVSQALARVGQEVRQMNHLVDLFLLSANAFHRQLEACENVSMARVVEAALERYPFASDSLRAKVSVQVRADFQFAGTTDLAGVILMNLLRNALKALHRAGKGRIRIVVDGRRDRGRLMFLDSGCGIGPDQLPLIFKRFHSYPADSGSGIGLALCRDIVEAWNGCITCQSREHAWTRFVIELPLCGQARVEQPLRRGAPARRAFPPALPAKWRNALSHRPARRHSAGRASADGSEAPAGASITPPPGHRYAPANAPASG